VFAISNILINTSDVKVQTPKGFCSFSGIQKIQRSFYFHVILENTSELKCSIKHPLFKKDVGFVHACTLRVGDLIDTITGFVAVVYAELVDEPIELYDLLDVGEESVLYTNNILSHNCEFIGSSHTLISATKLRLLRSIKPEVSNADTRIFMQPVPGRQYVTVVDTARGVLGDYSAFIIFDVSELPYRVAATYRNNAISPLLYPNIVFQLSKHYNMSYILVETNDIGEQIANILRHDLEYENILTSVNNGRSGQVISPGFGQQTRLGVRTTKSVKRIGCMGLKTQVESDKLVINDERVLYELFRFVNIGESYEAEEGHDDLVMCCVLFAWAMEQSYVKELTSVDLRQRLEQENESAMDENLLPFGIISKGAPAETVMLAVRRGDDSWLFVGDDDFDNRMMEKHESRGWVQ
jgi:hypothetical protein